jgi:pre-rRNA-processing protein TSR1
VWRLCLACRSVTTWWFDHLAESSKAPEDDPITPATKQLIHKSLLSFTKYFFPSVSKIYSSDTPAEAALLARAISEASPNGGRDDGRAYLVAEGSEGVRWSEVSAGKGRLEVTGTVRGGCLSADRLVHIPGVGDFEVETVCSSAVVLALT